MVIAKRSKTTNRRRNLKEIIAFESTNPINQAKIIPEKKHIPTNRQFTCKEANYTSLYAQRPQAATDTKTQQQIQDNSKTQHESETKSFTAKALKWSQKPTDQKSEFTYQSCPSSTKTKSTVTVKDSKSFTSSRLDIELDFLASKVQLENERKRKLSIKTNYIQNLLKEKAILEEKEVK